MKKSIRPALFLVLALLVFLACAAATAALAAPADQYLFTLLEDGSGYELTECKDKSITEAVIPAEYEGLPVKTIGDRAFTPCGKLTSFSVEEGQSVFYTEDRVLFTDDPVKTLVRYPNACPGPSPAAQPWPICISRKR